MLARRRCSAKGSARNRDENRVRVDTDRSFVSIHPPWHLASTPRTMSVSFTIRCPAGQQPNMLIQTIPICLIACCRTFSPPIISNYQGFLRKYK